MSSSNLSDEKSKPAHEIKLARIRTSIWANQGRREDVWYSVGPDDIPVARLVLDEAHNWVLVHEAHPA